jgi:hypothetical protein
MFDYDDLDVQQELTRIPPEYQDVFRRALERELADRAAGMAGELPPEQMDTDALHYLRQRRDDFRRGAYIRPDGRPDIVTADPESLYAQGLFGPGHSAEEEEAARERRLLRIKVAAFLLLTALFLFFALRGRAATPVGEGGEETAAASAMGEPTPTPALPEVGGPADSLQTIGGLGAALTIGRPSALELRYGATEETIALPIDPSQATPRGELRYNPAVMASDRPVAVWLFGTVVNYGIGLPDSLVRNLRPGDRILLNTDTGASLSFVVSSARRGSSHETAAVLSQNRPGMTLFALPAVADDDVALAFAGYDVAAEAGPALRPYAPGETFSLAGWGELAVTGLQSSHTVEGMIRIVINGTTNLPTSPRRTTRDSLLVSLTVRGDQTPAIPVEPAGGAWQATFTLPTTATGLPLYAELRTVPAGELAVVSLGAVPDLYRSLQMSVGTADWDSQSGDAMLPVDIHNAGEGAVYLHRHFIQVKGGDALADFGQVRPSLPLLLAAGETLGLRVLFPLAPAAAETGQVEDAGYRPVPGQVVQLQIGAGLWEVGVPPEAGGPGRP